MQLRLPAELTTPHLRKNCDLQTLRFPLLAFVTLRQVPAELISLSVWNMHSLALSAAFAPLQQELEAAGRAAGQLPEMCRQGR